MKKYTPIGKISIRDFESFFSSAADSNLDAVNILNLLKNEKNILVFGGVQSGKTGKIMKLVEESFLSNVDIVILFGGVSTVLLDQTERRVRTTIANKKENHLFIKASDFKSLDISNAMEANKKIFINIMKEASNLKKLYKTLFNLTAKSKKILIIDDESDYATVNVSKTESEVFKTIKKMSTHSDNVKFCMFTATPYANIVNSRSGSLKPKMIYLLKNSDEYTGISFFNKNDYIYSEFSDEDKDYNKILTSLKYFIFNSAVFKCSTKSERKFELVINMDTTTAKHDEHEKLFIKAIRTVNSELGVSLFEKKFEKQIFDAKSNGIFSGDLKTINRLCANIFDELKQIKNLHIIDQRQNKYKSDGLNYCAIIGGNLISRGFTFENLLVELMDNVPKNKMSADTQAQRARWLGYRGEYYQYMKILMSHKSVRAYREIEILNNRILLLSKKSILNVDNDSIKTIKKMKFEHIKLTGGAKNV